MFDIRKEIVEELQENLHVLETEEVAEEILKLFSIMLKEYFKEKIMNKEYQLDVVDTNAELQNLL